MSDRFEAFAKNLNDSEKPKGSEFEQNQHFLVGNTVWVLNTDFNNGTQGTAVFPTKEIAESQIRMILFESFSDDYKRSERELNGFDDVELPPFPEKWEDVTMDHVEAFFGLDGCEDFYWIVECEICGQAVPNPYKSLYS